MLSMGALKVNFVAGQTSPPISLSPFLSPSLSLSAIVSSLDEEEEASRVVRGEHSLSSLFLSPSD